MNTGLYLYAFAKNGNEVLPSDYAGIDPVHPIQPIVTDSLCAFVSEVDLEEFGREGLSRNLKNIHWLEEKARRHDQIIRALNDRVTIVPVRFGTIWLKPESIQEYIRKNAYKLKALLERFEGATEMGVTLYFDKPQAFAAMEKTDSSIAALASRVNKAQPGTAHLLRKQLERMKSERLRSYIDSSARNVIETLSSSSLDISTGPTSSHPDNPNALYVNIAALVSKAGLDSFLEAASQLQANLENSGASIRITGPWPPYSFSQIETQTTEEKRETG